MTQEVSLAEMAMQEIEALERQAAAEIDATIEEFSQKMVEAGASELVAVEYYSETLRKGAFQTPFIGFDGAGRKFRGRTLNNPYEYGTQSVTYAEIQETDGTVPPNQRYIIRNANSHKTDGSAAAQSGGLLFVETTAHALQSEPRPNSCNAVVIPGLVPYPQGRPQLGAEGGYVESGSGGGGEPVNYDEVERRVVAGARTAVTPLINNAIVQIAGNIIPKLIGANAYILRKTSRSLSAGGQVLPDDPSWLNDENGIIRAQITDYQDRLFGREMDNLYIGLNKHIVGENEALPVENEGFVLLISDIVRLELEAFFEPGEEASEAA